MNQRISKMSVIRSRDSIDLLLGQWHRERPDLDPSPVAIQGRILRLSAHFLRESERCLSELNLTWEAFSLIVTLRRNGKPYEMRPKDILRESLLTSGAVTNRVERVARMGLIERRPDELDGRGCIIRLTVKGKMMADKAIAIHFDAVDRVLAVLKKKEQRQLADLLAMLLGSMEKATELVKKDQPTTANTRICSNSKPQLV